MNRRNAHTPPLPARQPRSGHARRLLLSALCVAPCLLPGAQAQTPVVGVVSAIDIAARPGAAQEAGRTAGLVTALPGTDEKVLPLVELIHAQNLRACGPGGAARKCPQYEWSVPFIPESNALKLEEELSRAWNEFDARSTWYLNSLLNARPDPAVLGGVSDQAPRRARGRANRLLRRLLPSTTGFSLQGNCGPNAGGRVDLYVQAWSRNPLGQVDPGQFCKDVTPVAAAAVPSYIPGARCEVIDTPAITNWPEVNRRWGRAYVQALNVYYPAYWKRVYTAIQTYMPGSLAWDGVYPLNSAVGTMGGVQLQPVYAPGRRTKMYLNLAASAQARDAVGSPYMLQRYPYQNVLGDRAVSSAARARVTRAVPTSAQASAGQTWPGASKLEVLKYGLAQREDIFTRPDQWWKLPTPQGPTGAGDLRETEGVGAVSFLQLYSRVDAVTSPRPAEYLRWCFMSYLPPVPVLVRRTLPNIAEGIVKMRGGISRVHVRWESVPEGYPLRSVQGQPTFNLSAAREVGPVLTEGFTVNVTDGPVRQRAERVQDEGEVAEAQPQPAQTPPAQTPPAQTPPAQTAPGQAQTPRPPAAPSTSPQTRPPGATPPIQPDPWGTLPPMPTTPSTPAPRTPAPPAPAPRTPPPPATTQPPGAEGCSASASASAQLSCAARLILQHPRITLATSSSTSGGNPRQNLLDTVNGLPAARGCGPAAPNCGQRQMLSPKLLLGLLRLAQQGSFMITSINGGGHSTGSAHYTGEAVDIGIWNGIELTSPNQGHRQALNACLAAGSRPGQTFNGYNDANHADHVHCDFR